MIEPTVQWCDLLGEIPSKSLKLFAFRQTIALSFARPGEEQLSAAELEKTACIPIPVDLSRFNENAEFPYGCTTAAVKASMEAFVEFIGFLNQQLLTRDLPRLEMLMMPANFSSLVGEFIVTSIPKHCSNLVKNRFHNGHPDLVPKSHYPDDLVLHGSEGIEVKASRYTRAWQGHNAEECWLMVFVFQANSSSSQDAAPIPFQFRGAYLGKLEKSDWKFAGRSETSRRTITASVTKTGESKLQRNWIYKV